ncbi:filamentous hemagglutinin family outer membrane protein [[Leptolyngbya] sp. PCC 7376]|uniref:two-partner secretion domain-containing protein n=1 Tax=[Leptolyngbya] sp. PCC 7376 TaxID=111781 RepID=UPI00029F3952|nr:filamentous hemagglutinin N-terminal domain-containing protein [[Leptolyngbya] sp. PCC 7376]AFY39770.1 filamentous hemagglutinin family outer membrane protein [[Leptolyngbya] sp. PCC 7376]
MKKNFAVGISIVAGWPIMLALQVQAQTLIPDNSLGSDSSTFSQVSAIRQEVSGGALRNNLLLHSFQEFNVPEFKEVYFTNPNTVEYIFTRVTGVNTSVIDGTLGILGNANLFLINPNGINFGENASLDISGSFLASTAQEILTQESSFTNINAAIKDTLLTVNPEALFSNGLRNYLGDVTNQGDLAVGIGQSLTLQGNNLFHQGLLTTETGSVNLLGNNVFLNDGEINVSGKNGGEIYLFGANIVDVLEHSSLDASGQVNGGFIETSAPTVNVMGFINTHGETGLTGTWLLDPVDINIDASLANTISTKLNTNNVEISTAIGIDSAGDITLDATVSNLSSNSLTLTGRRFTRNSGNFNLGGDLIFNLNQVNPETNTPSSSINAAISSIGMVQGDRLIRLGNGTFAGETLNINRDITIEALNPAVLMTDDNRVVIDVTPTVFLDGEDTRQVVNITSASANFNDIGIRQGNAIDGGGIANDFGTVTLTNSFVSDNSAQDDGGGIVNDSGNIILTNSIVSNNSANDNAGGIDNTSGTVTLNNSSISNNSSKDNGGGIDNSSGTVTLTNSSISGNSADANNAFGGGIANASGTVVSSNSNISGNSAIYAGGIFNRNNGIVTLTTSVVSNNSAHSIGAGIYNRGTVAITNSTISGNSASGGGGIHNGTTGIATLTNSIVSENSASGGGGGINNRGTLTLTTSTVSNNFVNAYNSSGGGIDNIFGTVTITDSTVSNNSSGFIGGGIFNGFFGTVTLTDSIVSGNFANEDGGGIINIYGEVTLSNSTITGNTANVSGGGIYNNETITLANSTVSDNSASFGGGIFNRYIVNLTDSTVSGNSSSNGGGIFNAYYSTVDLADSTISGNSSLDGGGIFNSGEVTLSNSVFQENTDTDITNDSDGIVTLIGDHIFKAFTEEGGIFKTQGRVSINDNLSFTLVNTNLIVSSPFELNALQLNFEDSFIDTSSFIDGELNFTATDIMNFHGVIIRSNSNNLSLNLQSPSVAFLNSDITTSNSESGVSGVLNINSSGNITLDNSRLFTTSEPGSTASGGDINFKANQLNLTNFSLIDTSTYSEGNAGNVDIISDNLFLEDNSIVRSLTTNSGDAGNISLDIVGDVILNNRSVISTAATATSIGNSGDIKIGSVVNPANTLILTNGSQLQALTEGNGNAGDIDIYIENDVVIDGFSELDLGDKPLTFTNIETSAPTQILEQPSNENIASAQFLTDSDFQINNPNNANGNVEFSTRIPYSSIQATGDDNTVDIYAFEVTAGTNIIFDIDAEAILFFYEDENEEDFTEFIQPNLKLTLLDSNGDLLLDSNNNPIGNDDSFIGLGGSGSSNNFDPYLRHTFAETGTYYLRVAGTDDNAIRSVADRNSLNINDPLTTIFNVSPQDRDLSRISDFKVSSIDDPTDSDFDSFELRLEDIGGNPRGVIFVPNENQIQYDLNISVETPLIEGLGGSVSDPTFPSGILTSTSGQGSAGEVNLHSATLQINEGGEISAKTSGAGDGGTLNINSSQFIDLGDGFQHFEPVITVETSNAGRAGDININTPNFRLAETARITATATETATNLDGGGSININADVMDLAGTVGIFAETQGRSPAGSLRLQPFQQSLDLDINLFTDSQISASTSGIGDGGDLVIAAPRNIEIRGAGSLSASTSGAGKGGTVRITSENLTLADGVTISTASTNTGDAGDVVFEIAENLILQDSFVLANTTPESTGDGGTIDIDPLFTLLDNSTVAVSNLGTGAGGNILLVSDILELRNGSNISAETLNAFGGNISLDVPTFLLMRNASNITASAGTVDSVGNGGNIDIVTPFLVAFPNQDSNITANAFRGSGGNINIATNRLFGIAFTGENIPVRNDITVSSVFGTDGIVTLNEGFDSTSGVAKLPEDLNDPRDQIDESCEIKNRNTFSVIGRGGLPNQEAEILSDELFWTDFRRGNSMQTPVAIPESSNLSLPMKRLAIAQGFERLPNGSIQLVAAGSPVTIQAEQELPSHPSCVRAMH